MLGRGLEPPRLSALAPKASVSAISPPQHCASHRVARAGERSGAPTWVRTKDLSLKRRLLYQLSYGRVREIMPKMKCFFNYDNVCPTRRSGEVVTRRSAKPLCTGSIPVYASRASGGTGIRARLKIVSRKGCGFDPHLAHQRVWFSGRMRPSQG